MENLTIKKIIQKIKKINIQDIIKLKNEEGNGYYNVWKVVTFESNYILKQTTEKELNNYVDNKKDIKSPKKGKKIKSFVNCDFYICNYCLYYAY